MQPEEFTDILICEDRAQCAELALVLESQSIYPQVRWDGRHWILSVADESVPAARRELADYAAESRRIEAPRRARPAPGSPWPGVVVYALVIVAMALVAPEMRLGFDWLAAGRMDSGRMLAGDWWRPVTALTLHADAAHLLGNAFFGGFFGYSVARYVGGGFGWFVIVVCGALGNAANGVLSGADHRSIGASTAVFAALGILSAYCWRCGFRPGASRRERLAPVVAGLGLLAFTGTGGVNTDIGAHLLGFVTGFGAGLLIARFGFPTAQRTQLLAAALALGIVLVAWVAALA